MAWLIEIMLTGLLPTFGPLKPTDRKSLTTLMDDIEDFVVTKVNIETGGIYIKEKKVIRFISRSWS